jgi:hypothetical protein
VSWVDTPAYYALMTVFQCSIFSVPNFLLA